MKFKKFKSLTAMTNDIRKIYQEIQELCKSYRQLGSLNK